MATLDVYSVQGTKVGTVEVADAVFKAPVNETLLYQMVKVQRSGRRAGTVNTKTRADVNGSGRKIYKQKGTGRARHGDLGAPIFVGGGTVFGPHPRDWTLGMPRSARKGALRSALSQRLREKQLVVIDAMTLPAGAGTDDEHHRYTKRLQGVLKTLQAPSALLVDIENNECKLAARNLPTVKYLETAGLNVYDILRHDKLLLSTKALKAIEERLTP